MAILKSLQVFALALSFYIITPFVLFAVMIPSFIFRALVHILQQIMRKDLENIFAPLSNLFGIDQLYTRPTSTLVMGSLYKGLITKDLVCQLISEKWLNKQDASRNLQYPELRQGLHSWLGYRFWGGDNCFNVFNHVTVLETGDEFFKRESVSEMFVKMVNEPFKEGQSPWEILILPYYCNSSKRDEEYVPSTLVLFKVHHALMDGFSMMKLGQRDLGNVDTSLSSNALWNKDFSFVMKCVAVVRLPYFAAKHFVNENGFHVTDQIPPGREGKQVKLFTVNRVNLNKFKQIKSRHNCSVTSILLSGYAAAIRHLIIKKNTNYHWNSPTCVVPVPLPNHPEKLGNHMSFAFVNLPVHENNSCRRLQAIHRSLDSARKSLDPLCMYYALKCIGSLPSFAVKLFLRQSPVSLLLSNFPGPFVPLKISGHDCTEIFFNGGLLEGNIHMVCSCVGYDDAATLTISTDDYLLESNDEAEEFMQIMMTEFDFLSS